MINNLRIDYYLKVESTSKRIGYKVNNLNKSFHSLILNNGHQNEREKYAKSLVQFCEKDLNETIDDEKNNQIIDLKSDIKKIKWLSSSIEEIFISIFTQYNKLKPNNKWENSSVV